MSQVVKIMTVDVLFVIYPDFVAQNQSFYSINRSVCLYHVCTPNMKSSSVLRLLLLYLSPMCFQKQQTRWL